MLAYGYKTAHTLNDFQIKAVQLPEPTLNGTDVLVRVKASSFNPVDTKIRQARSSTDGREVILGWDAAGIVEKTGASVAGFNAGDEVYYAGELARDGSNAELQAVDYRLIAHKPAHLSFAEAAAVPLTSLTAHEALFERGFSYTSDTKVLVIGGAGGVGSMAIQLLKARTQATVIATASRPETIAWTRAMGADHVIGRDIEAELKPFGAVDIVFSTTHTQSYLSAIQRILRPFGSLVLIDDPKELDIVSFKTKALSVHWEFMFAKSMHGYKPEQQGAILENLVKELDAGTIKSTLNRIVPSTVEGIREAHTLLEAGAAIGKMVMEW